MIGRPAQATYYPAFDGLRGIAVLMVFLCHYGYMVWPTGWLLWGFTGVDLFFVLSGFLITGILFRTRHAPDYFKSFYWRRTLRIFPLYYTFWLLLAATAFVTHPVWTWQTLLYVVYLGNLVPISGPNPGYMIHLGIGHGYTWINIAHFWTLCVEEQFYLTWPLVIWLCRGRGRNLLMGIAAGGAALVLALRIYLQLHLSATLLQHQLIVNSTYCRVDTLLIGSYLNLWLTRGTASAVRVRQVGGWLIAAPLAVLAGTLATFGRRWPNSTVNPLLETYGYTLVALICCGIVLLAVDNRMWWTRALHWKPLAGLGIISYGFYLLHLPLEYRWVVWLAWLMPRGLAFLMPVMAFVTTYLLARVSYKYLELPFLRLKDRLRG